MKGRLLLIWSLLLAPLFALSQPAEKVCFSVPGGFYETSPVLEISPFYQQHHIRFTTNGNRPTAQSRLYAEPLLLDSCLYSTSDIYTIQISPENMMFVPDSIQHCIVIRAAVFDENDSCISEVATQSYFIHSLGCDSFGLPVVSICADSLDLFDYDRGIFVPGVFFDPLDPNWTGNYYQSGSDWERPMNIEFYELDNTGINQQAGLRTHGGNGRRYPQKCIKCYAREEYGKKRFQHRFFETIPQDSFKHLVLKPFASSWNYTGVNDYLCNLIAAQVNVEALASRPVILYLNGEYWGIYFIHERPDARYLEDHFDIDIDHVNIISDWNSLVDHGTSVHFDALFHWMETADLTDPEQYDWLKSQIDIDTFIDYQILELFLENNDWPANNMRCWQEGDGPWRWIFYDGDACLCWVTFYAFEHAVYEGNDIWPASSRSTLFFRKLLANETFCRLFYSRFIELMDTSFSYSVTGPWFDSIKQVFTPSIPFQVDRFGIPVDVETWNTYMNHTCWFLKKRCEYTLPVLDEFIYSYISVPEASNTAFEVFPNPSQGSVNLKIDSERQETATCFIYDMTGRQVLSRVVSLHEGLNTIRMDLPVSPGLYFLKINDVVTKIIRQ